MPLTVLALTSVLQKSQWYYPVMLLGMIDSGLFSGDGVADCLLLGMWLQFCLLYGLLLKCIALPVRSENQQKLATVVNSSEPNSTPPSHLQNSIRDKHIQYMKRLQELKDITEVSYLLHQ
jgi:hypothetical protein